MTDPDERRVLYRPTSEAQAHEWNVVGDSVMGGVSSGSVHIVETSQDQYRALVFEGQVRSDFGGGFASIELPLDVGVCAGANGLEVEIEGQGHSWRIRVKESDMQPGEAWQASIRTDKNRRTRIHVPFNAFVRTVRGRRLDDQGILKAERIDRIGLLIADGQTGPFRLTVFSITTR